jgi:hypothetical protein
MCNAHYKFIRSQSISGFLKSNIASTDAINALSNWENSAHERSYEILIEKDEELLARLTWEKSDTSAGSALDVACLNFGVERVYISTRKADQLSVIHRRHSGEGQNLGKAALKAVAYCSQAKHV